MRTVAKKQKGSEDNIPGDVGTGQEPVVQHCALPLLAGVATGGARSWRRGNIPARPASVRRSVKPILKFGWSVTRSTDVKGETELVVAVVFPAAQEMAG